MRLVPSTIVDAFYSGDTTGPRRNMVRVTVQHADTKLFQLPYNLYASYVFGSDAVPQELPNVKSLKWQRGIGQDFASATFVFYNTEPRAIGDIPSRDLDQPGYYTYSRGMTQFSSRWQHTPNRWQGMLMPDNVLRSYEGYGFDATVIPELDRHLVSTGVWRIDDVEYTHDGLITVTCRDVGSILGDQLIYPPIVPRNFFPVSFTGDKAQVGFVGPATNTTTQDTASVDRPASWKGPTDGPATVTAVASANRIAVSWTRPATADVAPYFGGDPKRPQLAIATAHKGYKVVGYQIALDGVILPKVYGAATLTATLGDVYGIRSGNVYSVRVIAIWQEVLTQTLELVFNTNVEQKARSNFSSEVIARPADSGATTSVTPGSIAINVDWANELTPGAVRFAYVGDGTYTLIAYQGDGSTRQVFKLDLVGSSGAYFDTGTALGDLTEWNYLIYGTDAGGLLGAGDVYFAGIGGSWFGAPAAGASPDPAPPTKTPVVTQQSTGTKIPLKTVDVHLSYDDSSNTPYVGRGEDVKVYGHDPDDAFGTADPYWLSIGNDVNSAGYSYEWIQGKCASVTLTSVTVKTAGKHYGLYVSVYSNGKWVQHSDTGVIPYNPKLPESHNHANIPYAEFHHMSDSDGEGPVTIHLRDPIPQATKVRVTFHNLQYFDVPSPLHYRAGCRALTAKGQAGGTSQTTTSSVSPPKAGSTAGSADASVTSVTTYTPAHILPGLGANPGHYEDYTDIVKLLCAWGGFYWPNGAYTVTSDGNEVQHSWGIGPYGLPNVDPVMGDVDGGRVWGDFQQTGTAGIATIPTSEWMQKSLMDGISYVRDIIGFIFYIDEDGGVVWRQPNIYSIGNWIGTDPAVIPTVTVDGVQVPIGSADAPGRVTDVVVIDEEQTLIGLRAKLSGRNVRERVVVATQDGSRGAMAIGWNPNPTGLRRYSGWSDQHFQSEEECRVMAELIAIRQMFQYRTDTVSIFGYPAIQVDDQIIIVEQYTGEGNYHYVNGITSSNDIEAGGWQYDLDTYWLGERPFDLWAFSPDSLSQETQTFLATLNFGVPTSLPTGSV